MIERMPASDPPPVYGARGRAAVASAALVLALLIPTTAAAALDDDGYLAYADRHPAAPRPDLGRGRRVSSTAADATVTGDGRLLRRDLALQPRRCFRGAAAHGGRAGNFGAGMRFHYLPYSSPTERRNVDSAEYASIALSFTRFYGQARRAGMPPLEPRARRLLRDGPSARSPATGRTRAT